MNLAPGIADRLTRDAAGLIPAVVQQYDTGEVLMLAWMNDEALSLTLSTDRKSTRLNSSHLGISYAVFCFASPRALHSFPTRRSSDLRTFGDRTGVGENLCS